MLTIHTADSLDHAALERAAELGPSLVRSTGPLAHLLAEVGFDEVEHHDLTGMFRESCEAILDFRSRAETELRSEEGDEAFHDQLGKKTRLRLGIREGLLERSLFVAS